MPNNTRTNNNVLVELTNKILEECKEGNVEIRVLGGIGVFLKCFDFRDQIYNSRAPFSDIDLITRLKYIEDVERIFGELGFEQNLNFKTHFGYQRRIFYDPHDITIEVYIDNLHFCQDIKIAERMLLDYPTISLTDLFLSKIQRINLDAKDMFDISILLLYKSMSSTANDQIDYEYISRLCSNDWKWWNTMKVNIKKLIEYKPADFDSGEIYLRLHKIERLIDTPKKSLKWNLRNLIGDKIAWYNYIEPDS